MWPAADLRELHVFLTVAEELHFGQAADRLRITPPRVSQIVGKLEAKVGGRLLDRTSRRVALTPLGDELRRRIAPPYGDLESVFREVRDSLQGVAGVLRLGMYAYALGGPRLFDVIAEFETRYPGCTVRVSETGVASNPFTLLHQQEIDLLAFRTPIDDPRIEIGPALAREERMLAVGTGHPLADREAVSVEDLADYTTTEIAAFPRETMDVFSPPTTPSGRPINRAPLRSVEEAILRVATGELVHLTVPWFFKAYPNARVIGIPVTDLPPSAIHLMWLKANRSPTVTAFAETTVDALR